MLIFRFHKGSLEESMKTVKEFRDYTDLTEYIKNNLPFPGIDTDHICYDIKQCCDDTRINWHDCHYVMAPVRMQSDAEQILVVIGYCATSYQRDLTKECDATGLVLLHSISATEFEVLDFAFPEMEQVMKRDSDKLNAIRDKWCEENRKAAIQNRTCDHSKEDAQMTAITQNMMTLDKNMTMAKTKFKAINHGDTIARINSQLWNEHMKERYYCVRVNLWFTKTDNGFETVFNYEEIDWNSTVDTWNCFPALIKKHNILYGIEYEHKSYDMYEVIGLIDVHDTPYMKTGLYYVIDMINMHHLQNAIPISDVDNPDVTLRWRLFTTPERAHNALQEMKERGLL